MQPVGPSPEIARVQFWRLRQGDLGEPGREQPRPHLLQPQACPPRLAASLGLPCRLENGQAGARYHAVSEEGVPLRRIAEVIGSRLNVPVESITSDEASAYFGSLTNLATSDLAAFSVLTRQRLGWNPTGPDLLTDLRNLEYNMA